jgi:serine/threonine protein kinase
MKAMNF